MKKIIIIMLIIVSSISLSAGKSNKKDEIPDIEARMEKADRTESYRAKKDAAWHKTEYNKVIKYLNKSGK